MDGWTRNGIYFYSSIHVKAIVKTWEAKEPKYIQCHHINKQLCFPTTHPKSFRPKQHHACHSLCYCFPNFFPWINSHIILHISSNVYYVNIHRSEVVQWVIAIQLPLHYLRKIDVRKGDTYMRVCPCVSVYRTTIFEALCVAHEDYPNIGHCGAKIFRRHLKENFGFSAVFHDLYLFIPCLLTEPLTIFCDHWSKCNNYKFLLF